MGDAAREKLGLFNYKPENINLPQNHLPEQGRELGGVPRTLGNIIPALLRDVWRVQLTSHQRKESEVEAPPAPAEI